MLTGYFQIQEAELTRKAVTDPRAAVAVDVALLRTIPALPGEWLISGLKRTLVEPIGMSALCQKQTHAPQQFVVIRSPRRR